MRGAKHVIQGEWPTGAKVLGEMHAADSLDLWGQGAHHCDDSCPRVVIGGGRVRNADGTGIFKDKLAGVHAHVMATSAQYITHGEPTATSRLAHIALGPTFMHKAELSRVGGPRHRSYKWPEAGMPMRFSRVAAVQMHDMLCSMGIRDACTIKWVQQGRSKLAAPGQRVTVNNLEFEMLQLSGPAGSTVAQHSWIAAVPQIHYGNGVWDQAADQVLTHVGQGMDIALVWGKDIASQYLSPVRPQYTSDHAVAAGTPKLSCWMDPGTHMLYPGRGRTMGDNLPSVGIAECTEHASSASRPGLIYCRNALALEATASELLAHCCSVFGGFQLRVSDGRADLFKFQRGSLLLERRHGITAAHIDGRYNPESARGCPNVAVWERSGHAHSGVGDVGAYYFCGRKRYIWMLELFAGMYGSSRGHAMGTGLAKEAAFQEIPELRAALHTLHVPGGFSLVDTTKLSGTLQEAVNHLSAANQQGCDYETLLLMVAHAMPAYEEGERVWVASGRFQGNQLHRPVIGGVLPNIQQAPTVGTMLAGVASWFRSAVTLAEHSLVCVVTGKQVVVERARLRHHLLSQEMVLSTTAPNRMMLGRSDEAIAMLQCFWPEINARSMHWKGKRILLLGLATYCYYRGVRRLIFEGETPINLDALEHITERIEEFRSMYLGQVTITVSPIPEAHDNVLGFAIEKAVGWHMEVAAADEAAAFGTRGSSRHAPSEKKTLSEQMRTIMHYSEDGQVAFGTQNIAEEARRMGMDPGTLAEMLEAEEYEAESRLCWDPGD